jgi:hypothetical protein
MNAHDVKNPSHQSVDAKLEPAVARPRFAAQVDVLVARWLQRRATNAEAAQRWFTADPKPGRAFGTRAGLVVSSPRWDEPL